MTIDVPSVRMKDDTRPIAIRSPLASPISAPQRQVAASAKARFSALPFIISAEMTTLIEMVLPTERSTPRRIMTICQCCIDS